uniref:ABC transporter ATP-binding protein n=1 Tax=Prevotella sp. TaxID=59823 RepID=UPI0040262342
MIARWLWHAWRGNRRQALFNALIGLGDVAVSLGSVWAIQHAIDVASHAAEGSILASVAVMASFVLMGFALSIASVWVRNLLGIRAQNRMQQQMLDRILRSTWRGKARRHSGDVLNRLETDVTQVVSFLTETIPDTLSKVLLFCGAFFYLLQMDWRLAIIIVLAIPLFALFSKIYMRQMRRLTREVRKSDSVVQSVLQETIQHQALIKTLEDTDHAVDRLEDEQRKLRQNVVRRTKFSVLSNLILNLGFSLCYLVAFAWAAIRMSAGSLTFGGMTAFLQLVARIQSPARQLTRLVPAFVGVMTAAERLMELEEDPTEEQGAPLWMDSPCGIRLREATYCYDDGTENVIDHLSFDFRPGSCTAILGPTGAGKTTLVRLLLALLSPKDGCIELYDGQSAHPLSPRTRCNLAYVPQGNTLLSGSIRDNLRLGKLNATDEEMEKALRKACADFVFDLPDGLNTACTEQGGGLSEGQAQRIAIARALLRNRSIMLFDEATSALDPETERQLLANVLKDSDKTIIFVTHRMAVTDYCDQTLTIGGE